MKSKEKRGFLNMARKNKKNPSFDKAEHVINTANEDTHSELERILALAYNQSRTGKGLDRHGSSSTHFENQPIVAISDLFTDNSGQGQAFQAVKKVSEATRFISRKEYSAAKSELLGAINYVAAMFLVVEGMESD